MFLPAHVFIFQTYKKKEYIKLPQWTTYVFLNQRNTIPGRSNGPEGTLQSHPGNPGAFARDLSSGAPR